MPICGLYRRFFNGTGFGLYSAGFGQGSFVGLQYPWFPPLGIIFGFIFAYRRYFNAR